jgi:hypothetical protein
LSVTLVILKVCKKKRQTSLGAKRSLMHFFPTTFFFLLFIYFFFLRFLFLQQPFAFFFFFLFFLQSNSFFLLILPKFLVLWLYKNIHWTFFDTERNLVGASLYIYRNSSVHKGTHSMPRVRLREFFAKKNVFSSCSFSSFFFLLVLPWFLVLWLQKKFMWSFFWNEEKLSRGAPFNTPKCVLVNFGFDEFGHFYHGENCQPPSEWGLVAMDKWISHSFVS